MSGISHLTLVQLITGVGPIQHEFPFWLPTASHNTSIEGFQRTFFLWLGAGARDRVILGEPLGVVEVFVTSWATIDRLPQQARLRPSNLDAAAGCIEELTRIVGQIRAAWPEVKIIVRGDSGFCREELMG